MNRPLLILGASARGAAQSALRAGLSPIAVDLFADRDLSAIADARRIPARDYPGGLASISRESRSAPWIYTGALENHPELVDRIASERTLWGNPGSVLRRVRDPFLVARSLKQAGIEHPEVRPDPEGLPEDGSWLVKPLASAGGRAISAWSAESRRPAESACWQERIEGLDLAAAFCAGPESAALLGVTRQFLGRIRSPYAYRGSVGPWPISDRTSAAIARIGGTLAAEFELRGLFGIDLILNGEVPYPVEINPRYSASMEVLELATGRSFLAEHCRAFESDPEDFALPEGVSRGPVVAKAIAFADRETTFRDRGDRIGSSSPWRIPDVADVPEDGSRFGPGEPILTLFAKGKSIEAAVSRLDRKLSGWKRHLRGSPD